MARPSNKSVMLRKKIVQENPKASNSELKALCIQQGINTTHQTLENDKLELLNGENVTDEGLKQVLISMQKIDTELAWNEKERQKATGSTKAALSRLVKDLAIKRSELAVQYAQLKLANKEKTEVNYNIHIGNFPEVQVKKEDVKDEE